MIPIFGAFGLSGGELMLVLVAILVLFGAKKIPEFAKGLGHGIKEFKKASREVQDELERATDETNRPPPPPPVEPPPQPPAEPPPAAPAEGQPPSPAAATPQETPAHNA